MVNNSPNKKSKVINKSNFWWFWYWRKISTQLHKKWSLNESNTTSYHFCVVSMDLCLLGVRLKVFVDTKTIISLRAKHMIFYSIMTSTQMSKTWISSLTWKLCPTVENIAWWINGQQFTQQKNKSYRQVKFLMIFILLKNIYPVTWKMVFFFKSNTTSYHLCVVSVDLSSLVGLA